VLWSNSLELFVLRHCRDVDGPSDRLVARRIARVLRRHSDLAGLPHLFVDRHALRLLRPQMARNLLSVIVNARTGWSICNRFRARLVIQRIAQPSDRDHAECAKVGAQRTSETTVTAPIFKRSVVGCPERHPKTSNQAAVASGHAMSPFGAVAPWVARRSFQITHRDVRMALRKSRSSRPVEVGANSAHGNTVIHGFRSALDKVLPVCGDVPCLNHASPHGSVCNVAWTKVDGGTTAPNV